MRLRFLMLQSIVISFTYHDIKGIFVFTFDMKVINKGNKTLKKLPHDDKVTFKVMINTKENFPFYPPKILFSWNLDDLLFDVNKLTFEEILQESWHPSLRVIDVIERVEEFITPLMVRSLFKIEIFCPILTLFSKVTSSISTKALIICSAIILRLVCNLLYYDITFKDHYNTIVHTMNHRIVDWYEKGDGHEFQSYPPLYGYLYYLIGITQAFIMDTPTKELKNVNLSMATSPYSLDFKVHNYVWIMLLTLFESFTLYTAVYMCIKSFYRKLTNRVKHSIIFLSLVCPVYLITNTLSVRFNSIMIGLMTWSLYFCINKHAELCVLCTVLAIHMEPKAFVFVIPMMLYTMKTQVASRVTNFRENMNIPTLIREITEKTYKVFGAYMMFFAITALIWLPWIINEDLTGMLNVARTTFLPQDNLAIYLIKKLCFLILFSFNAKFIVQNPTKNIILLCLFNLSISYSVFITMNADSISLIITCGFLAFYELKEMIFLLIITCIYATYPDVVKLQWQGLYALTGVIYCILVKIFMLNLITMAQDDVDTHAVELINMNQEQHLDHDLWTNDRTDDTHRVYLPIVKQHYHSKVLKTLVTHATKFEVFLAILLCAITLLEIILGVNIMHGLIMRGLMFILMIISHLILYETDYKEAPVVQSDRVKDKRT